MGFSRAGAIVAILGESGKPMFVACGQGWRFTVGAWRVDAVRFVRCDRDRSFGGFNLTAWASSARPLLAAQKSLLRLEPSVALTSW